MIEFILFFIAIIFIGLGMWAKILLWLGIALIILWPAWHAFDRWASKTHDSADDLIAKINNNNKNDKDNKGL